MANSSYKSSDIRTNDQTDKFWIQQEENRKFPFFAVSCIFSQKEDNSLQSTGIKIL